MKWLSCVFSIFLFEICSSRADQDWWKHAVFYQVYPRSFKDSNGDGIGDLKGITSKIQHFKDAGVDAIWLSPIYKSPQIDQGYDISDFNEIDEKFGTMEDFDELLEEAHNLGIKVIMDLVPNHSSNQHEWFVASEKREEKYEDYYIWRDEPNNWISNFKGSAWTYSETRQQFYYHQYSPEQPDLNYWNEEVVEEIKNIVLFWLERGVDGFRIDGAANLFEDKDFPDEPPSGTEGATENDWEYLEHIYTRNLPETYDMIRQLRELVDRYTEEKGGDARVIMTEVYADIENTMKYYGTEDGSELRAHFTFNFQLITKLNAKSTAKDVVDAIKEWMTHMPSPYTANWVLGNHDNYRVATRLGPENVDGYNMLAALLPGAQITYNGEEIGMENGEVTFEQGADPSACKDELTFQQISRDFERTPYHWDKTKNAGFSDSDEPWLPVSEKYTETNLEDQNVEGVQSHYHVYQNLVQLRKLPTFEKGDLVIEAVADDIIAFSRSLQGYDTYVCLFNIGEISKTLNLNQLFRFNDASFEVMVASVNSSFTIGSLYNGTNVNINPHESIVVRIIQTGDENWWKHAVFYQVYPKSFKDSDSDGVGDLRGIINEVDHFKNMGVDAILLSPIYTSPQVDHGYDVSDYRDVDPIFGTIEDFEELIEKIHELGIKLILDFVPNHSSKEHKWFELSENRAEGYDDFYVWKDAIDGQVPNNWLSVYKGSAWSWSDERRQYYLHQFMPEQPELNFRSEALINEIKNTMIFWLDKGVDGFKISAASHLFEDAEFRNEPLLSADAKSYDDLDHIYTEHQAETYDIIYQFRELIDKYTAYHGGDSRILMTEVYADIAKTTLYYGTEDSSRLGAHFTFNFQLINKVDSDSNARDLVNAIDEWNDYLPLQYTSNWVIGNHDNRRVATRFGEENVDGINTLVALLPGVLVTYNGEEIGMEDGEVCFDECKDPYGCKDETSFRQASRDFERTPYQWNGNKNAGFSDGNETWLPVSKKYLETNLLNENVEGDDSHYHMYQELLKLRQHEPFKNGNLKIFAVSDDVLAFSRTLEGHEPYVIVINFGTNAERLNLVDIFSFTSENVEVILSSSGSALTKGCIYDANDFEIKPHESAVTRVIQRGSDDWWKHAVFYEIYIRSFKDSDGDGIGDLKGITSKLNHFLDAGVDAVWLSPIYKSSGIHQGYDISDYRDIDAEYGTMNDFNELLEKAHELGIKLILQFVPNHSSNKHEWFTLSENKTQGYEDYYVWKDPVHDKVPNNWISHFEDSSWEYSEKRKQYYLHQFAKEQPDLNYRSEAVVQQMMDILGFWLDKGVDGFGIDGAQYLVEHEDFKDEPFSGAEVADNSYDYLDHIYTSNQPENLNVIYKFRAFVDNYTKHCGGDARIIVAVASTDVKNTMLYYGTDDGSNLGAHFAFNFQFITRLDGQSTAKDVVDSVNEWLNYMPLEYTANWALGTHDVHRIATRLGAENVDGFNMLAALLPGVLVTYNGEEIGMENGEVTFEQGRDPCAIRNETSFNETSRDFERTPYHWDKSKNAGFSDADETWLPVSEKFLKTNLADENMDGVRSHYHVYQNLVKFRQMEAFSSGKFEIRAISDNTLAFVRFLVDGDAYVSVFNLGDEEENINLSEIFKLKPSVQVLMTSVNSKHDTWVVYDASDITMGAHESILGIFTDDNPDITVSTESSSSTTSTDITTVGDTTTPDDDSSGSRLLGTFVLLLFLPSLNCLFGAKLH